MKLLILDLDRTLWSHPDISSTSPPYRRVSEDAVTDSHGNTIRLNPCARELLALAKSKGLLLAVASWNNPEQALAALEALGLKEYFDLIVVEPHPFKEEMIKRILASLELAPEDAIFVDDNTAICERVKNALQGLRVLNVGSDVRDLCDVKALLEQKQL
ncbi:magnesium-dependent phosphatase-1 [Infirmifilum lucidum]|uniref:Magnesium-dependent phosphatase-1 n=1 Tax=Infirmifilum lucidum TaxID=2776706 RepID=A0A7L9FH84_9CREN|nr:magnesium-dependent phosphatase-1 [Infirmifilum lucidum]QOJ79077.1 magnesium-dependent phosphatase-1 [Infirmifilum lucidum]